jgi:hypothetical protein
MYELEYRNTGEKAILKIIIIEYGTWQMKQRTCTLITEESVHLVVPHTLPEHLINSTILFQQPDNNVIRSGMFPKYFRPGSHDAVVDNQATYQAVIKQRIADQLVTDPASY